MKPKFKWIYLTVLIPIGLLIYSAFQSNGNKLLADYFTIPLYAGINILIALIFAYFLTQNKNDTIRKKAILEKIIDKIILSVSDSKMYIIESEDDVNHIRITQRSIKNRISLLKIYEKEFFISDQIKYISEEFDSYWDSISNHISEIDHLKNSTQELLNYVTKVSNGLETLLVNLYK